jgi:prolyl-tRNA synthetase
MRVSNLFFTTLREVPAEAESLSHQLMLRAGLMRKLASGVYSYLPLGLKVLRKTEQIIREEMNAEGAQELLMAALLPKEYYEASGRWAVFGPNMFRLKDRGDRDFCLGPTHEEIFTDTVKACVKSYRQLPVTLYQIQTKYRDEIRPRFGVIRSREFIMKDAYSFDRDAAGLDVSYQKMYRAYRKAFDRMGLDYIVVDADSGAMGGSGSQEFMVKSDIGEDTVVYCAACGYSANMEKAKCVPEKQPAEDAKAMEKVATPKAGTIGELTAFFQTDAKRFAKTLVYLADGKPVAAMVRGDRELNEVKLANALGAANAELADAQTVAEITGAAVGFAGPVGLEIPLLVDWEIMEMKNFIVGANETDFHYKNVNVSDFAPEAALDLRNIVAGDVCPVCGKPEITLAQGIEVGHIFKLGAKYTDALDCTYLDENGKTRAIIMGCYGIGVNRCVAAAVEQHSDENGILWPVALAPYHAVVIPVNAANAEQLALAEKIYETLLARGVDALLDDRDERAGVKFKDADLIGFPLRITVGKRAAEGVVEYKPRREANAVDVTAKEAVEKTVEFIKKEKSN